MALARDTRAWLVVGSPQVAVAAVERVMARWVMKIGRREWRDRRRGVNRGQILTRETLSIAGWPARKTKWIVRIVPDGRQYIWRPFRDPAVGLNERSE